MLIKSKKDPINNIFSIVKTMPQISNTNKYNQISLKEKHVLLTDCIRVERTDKKGTKKR
jgi:hypothetical protein